MSDCILPPETVVGSAFREAVASQRIVFVAGLPSSGKSLMLQQLTILAHEAGRTISTLQWDSARRAFETPRWLEVYPEIGSLTHVAIRRAVGLWVREGIRQWHERHADDRHILIAELPVVDGRFTELLRPEEDEAELLLSSDRVTFFVPVPTLDVRKAVVAMRSETFDRPRHAQETRDAPVHIVQNDWVVARRLYNAWNGIADDIEIDQQYDPAIYSAVFTRLGRFRNLRILDIDREFRTHGSAYERPAPVRDLMAQPADVEAAYARLKTLYPGRQAEKAIDGWAEY